MRAPIPDSHEVLIATRGLPGVEALIACLDARVTTRILDPDADPLAAIVAALADPELGSLHLVGHGAPGSITITPGKAIDATAVRHLYPATSPRVEVNLWSSFTGAERRGRHFVQTLAEAALVRVLASDGVVGGPERGASWDLPIAARPRGLAPFMRPGRDALRLPGIASGNG
jgi:hypothetical protein